MGFDPRPVHVGIVVNKVAMEQVLVSVLAFPVNSISKAMSGTRSWQRSKLHNYRNVRVSLWNKFLPVTQPVL